MRGLLRLAGAIDGVSRFFGTIAAWLVLLSCLTSAGNAVSRYLFSASSNAWLEVQWQMFAGIFLLGSADVLRLNEHVRVDLLYGSRSERGKLWTDVIGLILFLFPSMLIADLLLLAVLPDQLPQRRAVVQRRRPAALAGQAAAAARARAAAAAGDRRADQAHRRRCAATAARPPIREAAQ